MKDCMESTISLSSCFDLQAVCWWFVTSCWMTFPNHKHPLIPPKSEEDEEEEEDEEDAVMVRWDMRRLKVSYQIKRGDMKQTLQKKERKTCEREVFFCWRMVEIRGRVSMDHKVIL